MVRSGGSVDKRWKGQRMGGRSLVWKMLSRFRSEMMVFTARERQEGCRKVDGFR